MMMLLLACAGPEALDDPSPALGRATVNGEALARGETDREDTGADTGPAATTVEVGPYVSWASDTAFTVVARLSDESSASLYLSDRPDLHRAVRSAPVGTSRPEDNTVHFDVAGLDPLTPYFYAVVPTSGSLADAEVRQLTTFAPAGEDSSFSFVVVSDAQAPLKAPVFDAINRNEDPAFLLQIGDLDHRNPVLFSGLNPDAWWQMHRESMKTGGHGASLDAALLDHVPFFHMWDDHDYGLDDADSTAPYRDVALRAFDDYFPAPARPAPDEGLYYKISYGNVEVYMLDLRSQRSPNWAPDLGDKSMLQGFGGTQKDWLLSELLASTATWKVIVSTSCWNPDGKTRDSWSNYVQERDEIINTLDAAGVTGLFVISGDIHSGGGIDDGTHSHWPEMTVPTTNMVGDECTAPSCGTWSEGVTDVHQRTGYARVTFSHFGSTGVDLAELSTLDQHGDERLSYTLVQ